MEKESKGNSQQFVPFVNCFYCTHVHIPLAKRVLTIIFRQYGYNCNWVLCVYVCLCESIGSNQKLRLVKILLIVFHQPKLCQT